MGMYVSRLRSVPVGMYQYYTYLLDSSAGGAHTAAIDRFFDGFARSSGVDAVIVRGPGDFTSDLFNFLADHTDQLGPLENLFHEATCLVICEGALQTTDKPVFILPLRLPDDADPAFADALLSALLNAMREHRLSEFVDSLGALSVELKGKKGGMFVSNLRAANQILGLKPGIFGFSVNLNALVDKYLGPEQRKLRT